MGQLLSSPFVKQPSKSGDGKLESDFSSDWSSITQGEPPAKEPEFLKKSSGFYWHSASGEKVLDACGGAGVACIGQGRKDVLKAMYSQMKKFSYVSYVHYKNKPTEDLSDFLIQSTGGVMKKVYIMCSGSEAVEASLKLAREYFVWAGQPQRRNFIARSESYHGATLGSLSASGHVARRDPFEPLLLPNVHRTSACNAYRQRKQGESDASFVARKVEELEAQFQALGPDTVAAVIVEPVVGAALGCIPDVEGYLFAVRQVCDRYGALLIFDEVMCGMGRTGVLHAWQHSGVIPDLQTIGKGLAGGYAPASALLVGARVAGLMTSLDKTFTHGHTYSDNPIVAAAALAVQKAVQKEGCVANARNQGRLLERLLRESLAYHPNVGNIRGRGLFWGIEFVKDKKTMEPFDPSEMIAQKVHKAAARDEKVIVYHGQGCAGNKRGDHIMLMPALNVTPKVVAEIVQRVTRAIEAVFEEE